MTSSKEKTIKNMNNNSKHSQVSEVLVTKNIDYEKNKALKRTSSKKDIGVSTTKSASCKKTTNIHTSKNTASKKATNTRTTKKIATKSTVSQNTMKSASRKKSVNVASKFHDIVEYYDLPYRYNQTTVKVLAQNPNTLFVYWDIADSDRNNFVNKFGENFFNITKPVLVIHNLTDNYSYKVYINDFANNWYIHVDDTKCKYVVELGRVPIEKTRDLHDNFLNISYSNTIEMPNDHVLFFKDNDKIYFKNIKTNKVVEKTFKYNTYGSHVKEIYNNFKLSEHENKDRFDFQNPSSQNPTSNVL